uniref:Uncharacterized protein n=1 Tax=Leersia perrieri TaxID=77586 RepID=A0A0D9W3C4_9ORYZ
MTGGPAPLRKCAKRRRVYGPWAIDHRRPVHFFLLDPLPPPLSPKSLLLSPPSRFALLCSLPAAAAAAGGGRVIQGRLMLRQLKSAAAPRSPVRSPPPAPSASTTRDGSGFEGDEEEESVRAIAVSDQRTIYLVNMFIANTVEFLNSFSALCNNKLALLHRKIVKLDSSLALLEAKLHSIDDANALGHSTNQKVQTVL